MIFLPKGAGETRSSTRSVGRFRRMCQSNIPRASCDRSSSQPAVVGGLGAYREVCHRCRPRRAFRHTHPSVMHSSRTMSCPHCEVRRLSSRTACRLAFASSHPARRAGYLFKRLLVSKTLLAETLADCRGRQIQASITTTNFAAETSTKLSSAPQGSSQPSCTQ